MTWSTAETRRGAEARGGGKGLGGVVLAKGVVWLAALSPAAWLVRDWLAGALGANPIETVMHRTGWWGLLLLMAALGITPLRRVTGWHRVARVRRLVGLFAFAYLTSHFLSYVVLDQFFAIGYMVEDIAERPFITVGFAAWLILVPLAVTSTRGWIRRLGRKWRRLHRLVYVAAALGTLHFLWKVKADTREPLVFIAVLALLLALRLLPSRRRRKDSTPRGVDTLAEAG